MKTNRETAKQFSGGNFDTVIDRLAERIEWNMYEEGLTIKGRKEVIIFCKRVSDYFKTLTTNFTTFGVLEEGNKVSIYGRAEFIRDSVVVNTIQSCDVYEFDNDGMILVIHSYCNSQEPNK